jgi:DNA processing protein
MDASAVRVVLARAPGLRARHLRALFDSASADLTRCIGVEALSRVDLPPKARAWLVRPEPLALDRDLRWIDSSGARLLCSVDEDYPPQLLELNDAPATLFVLGTVCALAARQLAVVGSRAPSPDGRERAYRFAAQIARSGITVTSGLALGIDAAAHEGALAGGGPTVAVCGTGLDSLYPIQHTELAARIRTHGALVSEFPPGTPPHKHNFPQRNRLISGLSLGTLVVEAGRSSGSLVTARWARRQGRRVFAIPGALSNPTSGGCHKLLQEGATLVQHPAVKSRRWRRRGTARGTRGNGQGV